MSEPLRLYVKIWCPWCTRAQEWLDGRGYQYELIDVEADREDFEEMRRLSGQAKTPTLVVGERVLPDFGPEELEEFVEKHGIKP